MFPRNIEVTVITVSVYVVVCVWVHVHSTLVSVRTVGVS